MRRPWPGITARRTVPPAPPLAQAVDLTDLRRLLHPAAASDFLRSAHGAIAALPDVGRFRQTAAPPRAAIPGGRQIADLLASFFAAEAYARPSVTGGNQVADLLAPFFAAQPYVRPAATGGRQVASFLVPSFFEENVA